MFGSWTISMTWHHSAVGSSENVPLADDGASTYLWPNIDMYLERSILGHGQNSTNYGSPVCVLEYYWESSRSPVQVQRDPGAGVCRWTCPMVPPEMQRLLARPEMASLSSLGSPET